MKRQKDRDNARYFDKMEVKNIKKMGTHPRRKWGKKEMTFNEFKEVSSPARLQEGVQVRTFHPELRRGLQVPVPARVCALVFGLQVSDQKLLDLVFHLRRVPALHL